VQCRSEIGDLENFLREIAYTLASRYRMKFYQPRGKREDILRQITRPALIRRPDEVPMHTDTRLGPKDHGPSGPQFSVLYV
jgi:hypothetical protein